MKIQEFIDELSTRYKSGETIRAYRQDLERFERFLKLKGLRINQVKRSTIVEYIKHLEEDWRRRQEERRRKQEERRGKQEGPRKYEPGHATSDVLSAATINRRLTVLSEYIVWAQGDSDKPVHNPVARYKRPKVQNENPSPVDDDDLQKLCNGVTDLRDKSIILTFLESGLRLSELEKLNVGSVRSQRRKSPNSTGKFFGFGTVTGKGGKKRDFMMGPVAMKALQTYLASRTLTDSSPLFVSHGDERLGCRAIQKILSRWCRRLGIGHVRVHQLRHSFATRNVAAGMPMDVLKELLGHKELTTTSRYYKVRKERIQREYYAATEFAAGQNPVNAASELDLHPDLHLVKRRPAA